jgi:hypothetical protein
MTVSAESREEMIAIFGGPFINDVIKINLFLARIVPHSTPD